jgi:hypothetical protein
VQGVAATLLACCEEESELQWLAAAGVFPLVALLHSHYFWTQEASMQILYNIGLEVEAARKAIWVAGGVHALVSIIALDRWGGGPTWLLLEPVLGRLAGLSATHGQLGSTAAARATLQACLLPMHRSGLPPAAGSPCVARRCGPVCARAVRSAPSSGESSMTAYRLLTCVLALLLVLVLQEEGGVPQGQGGHPSGHAGRVPA